MFKFYVKGQFLGRKDSTFVVADSADYLTATVSFSSDWDGYEKIVYFNNPLLDVPWQITLDINNEIKKNEHLNLTDGKWEVYVHGQRGTSEITTNSIYIEVTRCGLENGEPFPIKPQTFGQWVKEKLDWFIGIIINTGDGTEFLANDGTYKPVSGSGSYDVWYPTVSTDGIITWQKSVSTEVPTEQNIKGNQGLQGPKGDTGATGLQGLKGDTGVQGIQGIQGEKGDTGLIGLPGIQGIQGETGEVGAQGLKGDTGATGPQGIQGLKGDTGAPGIQGLKGDAGFQGIQGLKGDTGATGSQGIQGLKGDTGAIGSQGIQGLKGDTGATGPAGTTVASEINIIDSGNYYSSINIEAALQEIAKRVNDNKITLSCELLNLFPYPWQFNSINTGTYASYSGGAKHPGVMRFGSSGTVNSGYSLIIAQSQPPIALAGKDKSVIIFGTGTVFTTVFRRMGFMDQASPTVAVIAGLYFDISEGILTGKAVTSSVMSTTLTSYTVSLNTWYRGVIELNEAGTTATFTLYGEDSDTILWQDTLSTNIPLGVNTKHADFAWSTSTNVYTTLSYIDYMSITLQGARRT